MDHFNWYFNVIFQCLTSSFHDLIWRVCINHEIGCILHPSWFYLVPLSLSQVFSDIPQPKLQFKCLNQCQPRSVDVFVGKNEKLWFVALVLSWDQQFGELHAFKDQLCQETEERDFFELFMHDFSTKSQPALRQYEGQFLSPKHFPI